MSGEQTQPDAISGAYCYRYPATDLFLNPFRVDFEKDKTRSADYYYDFSKPAVSIVGAEDKKGDIVLYDSTGCKIDGGGVFDTAMIGISDSSAMGTFHAWLSYCAKSAWHKTLPGNILVVCEDSNQFLFKKGTPVSNLIKMVDILTRVYDEASDWKWVFDRERAQQEKKYRGVVNQRLTELMEISVNNLDGHIEELLNLLGAKEALEETEDLSLLAASAYLAARCDKMSSEMQASFKRFLMKIIRGIFGKTGLSRETFGLSSKLELRKLTKNFLSYVEGNVNIVLHMIPGLFSAVQAYIHPAPVVGAGTPSASSSAARLLEKLKAGDSNKSAKRAPQSSSLKPAQHTKQAKHAEDETATQFTVGQTTNTKTYKSLVDQNKDRLFRDDIRAHQALKDSWNSMVQSFIELSKQGEKTAWCEEVLRKITLVLEEVDNSLDVFDNGHPVRGALTALKIYALAQQQLGKSEQDRDRGTFNTECKNAGLLDHDDHPLAADAYIRLGGSLDGLARFTGGTGSGCLSKSATEKLWRKVAEGNFDKKSSKKPAMISFLGHLPALIQLMLIQLQSKAVSGDSKNAFDDYFKAAQVGSDNTLSFKTFLQQSFLTSSQTLLERFCAIQLARLDLEAFCKAVPNDNIKSETREQIKLLQTIQTLMEEKLEKLYPNPALKPKLRSRRSRVA